LDNWTGEEFALMSEKLAERKRREADAMRVSKKADVTKVSDKALFTQAGSKIKVVKAKHGN